MRSHVYHGFLTMLVVSISALTSWSPCAAGNDLTQTTLTIKGMTCGGCVAAVKHRLSKVEGVTDYDVSLEKGEADVTYDPERIDPGSIADAVSETGFKATVKNGEDGKEHDTGEPEGK